VFFLGNTLPLNQQLEGIVYMQDIKGILFPEVDASMKHPHTKEVIALAEQSGISLTKISEILKCSQPYVSQLKAGSGKVKVIDLEPLISLLSPKLPGESFHTYTVFREARPIFPDDWEQQVLMTGLIAESKKTQDGLYPLGEDGVDMVERLHYKVLEQLDDNGEPYRSINAYNSPLNIFKRSKDITERVRETLDTYQAEIKKQDEWQAERDEELKRWTVEVLRGLPSVNGLSEQAAEIEEALTGYLKPRYEQENSVVSDNSWRKSSLVNVCREAADILNMPSLIKEYTQEEYLDFAESSLVLAPEEHAKRLLDKLESHQKIFEEKQQEKKRKFRLQKLFKVSDFNEIVGLKVTEPRELPAWEAHGQELFGGMVRKVFREANMSPYEINFSNAFTQWASNIEYQINEELVQVCGRVFHSETLSRGKLVIHELNSRKFVYLSTFNSEKLEREVTLLSKPLSAIELLEQLKVESKSANWANEIDPLILNLRDSLSENGYRVPGIRAIY